MVGGEQRTCGGKSEPRDRQEASLAVWATRFMQPCFLTFVTVQYVASCCAGFLFPFRRTEQQPRNAATQSETKISPV